MPSPWPNAKSPSSKTRTSGPEFDADRADMVFMTFNPGTDHEVRVYLDPLAAIHVAQHL